MIDLHAHTTCSDGTDTPLALVKKAAASGITVLGVTDHDSTSGWTEATSALHGNLQLALGAEVSCLTTDGISVHMLGLLFDGENQALQKLLSDSRDTRIPRMKKMSENKRKLEREEAEWLEAQKNKRSLDLGRGKKLSNLLPNRHYQTHLTLPRR